VTPTATSRRRGPPRYTAWRRACQAASALLFLALPFLGTTAVTGTAIALRAGPVDLLEPASALSAWLAAGTATLAAALAAAPLVVLAAALGGVCCAWLCPYGLLSEGLDRLRGRRRWPAAPWIAVRLPRLAALGALLVASAACATPIAALLAPPRLATALPVEARALGAAPLVTLALLAAVVAVDLLVSRRIVCRALCPAGGLAALLRGRAWRPRLEAARCACPESPACLQACAWGLDPRLMGATDGCTSCLACVERCPTGALTLLRRGPGQRRDPDGASSSG
jgi:ferredoxin-type protein NapH